MFGKSMEQHPPFSATVSAVSEREKLSSDKIFIKAKHCVPEHDTNQHMAQKRPKKK